MLGDNGAETAGIVPPPKLPANEPKLGAEKSGLLRLRAGGPIFCSIYRWEWRFNAQRSNNAARCSVRRPRLAAAALAQAGCLLGTSDAYAPLAWEARRDSGRNDVAR